MEKGRAKRGRKAAWHLTLGLKEIIFAAVGVVGLMMMSFALGALAGRGDIYRVAYSMGLLAPEPAKMAQLPAAAAPPGPEAAPGSSPPGSAPAPPAPGTKAAPPVTGNLAEVPGSAAKKTKTGPGVRDPKAREEELRRSRQEMVRTLKFQNSFDTAPKTAKPAGKPKPAAKPPAPVKVAQFREEKAAQAKVAELQKQGIKASVKQSKDKKGTLFTVYKPGAAPPPGPDNVAQKPEKSHPPAAKPKPE